MAAALGGLDALVFTGGVGERRRRHGRWRRAGSGSWAWRSTPAANEAASRPTGRRDRRARRRRVRAFVIPAREDVEIARGVREVLAGS